ncbi:tyrosine-type recombinase/integrase [Agarivorans sp. JK6]|uniref:tyrosine-type recombinase/integrase n=1 Tax=Agarivorans sp. JK6 TaxID=2997426 RepID=UPI003872B74E
MVSGFNQNIGRGLEPFTKPSVEKAEKEEATKFNKTISEVLGYYQSELEKQGSKKEGYINNLVAQVHKHVASHPISEAIARDVTVGQAKAYLNHLEATAAPSVAASIRMKLRAAFNVAATDGLIADEMEVLKNAWEHAKTVSRDHVRTRILDEDEIRSLLVACKSESRDLHDVVLMILWTGLRKSNALKARWSWVDRKALTITIPSSEMKASKAHTVPLSPAVVQMLERRSRALPKAMNAPDGLIFGKVTLDGYGTNCAWQRALVKVEAGNAGRKSDPEIPREKRINAHDLRRTAGSVLTMSSSLETASRILGHANVSLTHKHYGHLTQSHLSEAVAAMYDNNDRARVIENAKRALMELTSEERAALVAELQ